MRVLFLVLSVSIVLWGWGAELSPVVFRCTGQMEGEICWLRDSRLYAVASWHFPRVSPGPWTLVLEAVSDDPCVDCPAGRDVTVQVFWRESPAEPWNWRFAVMRRGEAAACVVRAELPVRLSGPELWLLVRRAVLCEPHLGFSRFSVRLQPPAVVELPPPPPPPEPVPPPPPPPPITPPPPACPIGPLFACMPGSPPAECVPATTDLATVVRNPLPDTYGPGDAHPLDLGHYVGEMGPEDWQDWYKFSVVKGAARLVYFRALGDLVVDLYLVHDPCGTDLAICLNVQDEATLHAPCQAGVECILIPDGPTECFPGPRCGFFVRIVWRSGSGKYFLSVLPAELAP